MQPRGAAWTLKSKLKTATLVRPRERERERDRARVICSPFLDLLQAPLQFLPGPYCCKSHGPYQRVLIGIPRLPRIQFRPPLHNHAQPVREDHSGINYVGVGCSYWRCTAREGCWQHGALVLNCHEWGPNGKWYSSLTMPTLFPLEQAWAESISARGMHLATPLHALSRGGGPLITYVVCQPIPSACCD